MRTLIIPVLLVLMLVGSGCRPRSVVIEVTATPVPTETPLPPTPTPAPVTVCATGCDYVTIQAAIDADAITSGAIIDVTDAVHTEGGIAVDKDVVIRGQGAEATIVQAHAEADQATERVFSIGEGAVVTIQDLTIRHGWPQTEPESGGGLYNHGTLWLERCVIRDNVAKDGGGMTNEGWLRAVDCVISHNTTNGTGVPGQGCGSGGGIRNPSGRMELVNCTVSHNTASASAGGVHVGCASTAVLTNCTISGNTAANVAGGVRVRGRVEMVHCTISDNTGRPNNGGGVSVRGVLSYTNTIIAGNGTGGDCILIFNDGGKQLGTIGVNRDNLVGDGGCEAEHAGEPALDVLGGNGGVGQTHALLPGSPAIDAVSAGECVIHEDQRGQPRPQGGGCDLGAYESEAGD